MAIFQNQKQAKYYLPFLNELSFKTSLDCQFYASIVRSVIDVNWKYEIKYLIDNEMWKKDKEKQKVIKQLFKTLLSLKVIKDSDMTYLETFQIKDTEEVKVKTFKRSDGSIVDFEYNEESRKEKDRIKHNKRYRQTLRNRVDSPLHPMTD